MAQRLMTRAAIAARMGIREQVLSRYLLHSLKRAVVGDRVDYNHPDVIAYYRRRRVKDTSKALHPLDNGQDLTVPIPEPTEAEIPTPMTMETELLLEDVKGYMDMTLRQLVEKHGTVSSLKDYLDAVKLLMDIEAKDLKNNLTSREYISRDFVKTHVLGLIETVFVRLLNDVPSTLVDDILVRNKAGSTREQLEAHTRSLLSKEIQSLKEKARRNLAK